MVETSYQDLKRSVWEKGRCSGCGACTAVCPADALYFDEDGTVSSPVHNGYCKQETDGVPCGACYAVCPRVELPAPEPLGQYRRIIAGQASQTVPRSQSGGAVTAILKNALDTGLIDAVVTVGEDRMTLRPFSILVTSSEELLHSAGSRYSWWVPLLGSLKTAVIDRKFRKIAVVGVPCVVQAVDRMRTSGHDLLQPFGKSIRLVIGLFCTESFDYRMLVEGKMRQEHAIETWRVKKLDVRGKLEITMSDGSTTSFPLKDIEDTVRSGCHVCTDFPALKADISAGSVGSAPGYTTLVVRTPEGDAFVDSAVHNGVMWISEDVDKNAIEKLATAKIARNVDKTVS